MKIQSNNIPQYLKDNMKWCCWNYQDRNGKKTKIPINPLTGTFAKVNDLSSFVDYDKAIKCVDKYDGLGIKVSSDLIAGDIDHCIDENGNLSELAKDIINHFLNSYFEYSPSGKGLRFFLRLPENSNYNIKDYKMKNGNLELYVAGFTNRFVTVTGNVYQQGNIESNNDSFNWLLETYLKREKQNFNLNQENKGQSYLTDEEVLFKASKAKNGEKFKRLYAGDFTNYPSQSEADIALCSILAFYCGGNQEQMDKIFRSSKLYRPKWDQMRGSDTYGNLTIKRAINTCNDFYKPVVVDSSELDFNDELSRLLDLKYPDNNTRYPWNEIGSARLFADFYKGILRYVPERKSWFFYSDGIWKKDIGSLNAMKKCMKLAKLVELSKYNLKDSSKNENFDKFQRRWRNHHFRVNTLKDAQPFYPIYVKDFDSNPLVINCKNGTYNLKTHTFNEHNPSDLLTKKANVIFDINSNNNRWNTFIKEIMSNDIEKEHFIQKIFGYGISGNTKYECMTILYGATTRNGKGTLCESILNVLGSYGCTSRPETIAVNKNNNSSSPSEDVARLAGVRFVNISEPKKGLVLNAAKVKTMTGNDTINARFLHENSFDFKPQFKIFINTNYLPVINDQSIFLSNRVHIIPFNKHFSELEQDKNLKTEFAKEDVKSAILNWLINGYKMLSKQGLSIPNCIKQATDKYEHDNDKITLFMEDCLEKGQDYEVKTSEVYNRYKQWCFENGHYCESIRTFKQSLAGKVNIVKKRPKGTSSGATTLITGYRLISEFLE